MQNAHDVADVLVRFFLGLGEFRLNHVEKRLRVVLQVAHPGFQLCLLQQLCLHLCYPLLKLLRQLGEICEGLVMDLENVIPQLFSRLEGVELRFGRLRQPCELPYFGICLLRVELQLLLHDLLKLGQLGAYVGLQPI